MKKANDQLIDDIFVNFAYSHGKKPTVAIFGEFEREVIDLVKQLEHVYKINEYVTARKLKEKR